MNHLSVCKALEEAKRFVRNAEEWMEAFDTRNRDHCFNAPKPSGATRRASMDLTRALAEMRKPG